MVTVTLPEWFAFLIAVALGASALFSLFRIVLDAISFRMDRKIEKLKRELNEKMKSC
jgi:hypothetical protein